MFIGEGPGRDEDLQGRPFVGKAGELLDKMIGAIGLSREETYIANVVKCRPPDNRTPNPEEARACLGYLHRQIELIRPTVIVTLGATPLRELVGVNEGITRVRGQWKRVQVGDREIPVMPTFHPAYVLRQYTQDVRRAVWEDLKAAKDWIDKAEEV
jgi:DNA polymerase